MVAALFPLSSAPGRNSQESAGRLINCYADPQPEGSRARAIYRRVPGLAQFATSSLTGFRGMIEVPGTLFAGFADRIVKCSASGGALATVGTLSGTKKLIWARNNNAVPDVVAVDPDNGAFVVLSTSVLDYPDTDLGQPNGVCFLGGYFFFTFGSALTRATGINSTSINTLDFATAETKTDGLKRPIPWRDQLFLFGDFSTEVWAPPVNDTGFPFNRVTTINRGLAGRYAIAGHEDGFNTALCWVGDNNRVQLLKGGYEPDEVSSPDLDRLIEKVADKDELEASVYIADGVPRWSLSASNWTWELNLNTVKWNERESHLLPRGRATQSHFAFGKWLTGDTQSGNIHQISAAVKTEASKPLRARLESAPVHKFPAHLAIAAIDVDVTVGVGVVTGADPNETDPTLEISVTRDGANFTTPRLVQLGKQAKAKQRVRATRFGRSTPGGVRVRLDVSDPIEFGIMGVELKAALTA